MRSRSLVPSLGALLLLSAAVPNALATEDEAGSLGEITSDLEDQEAQIRKEFGDRPLKEMSRQERREFDERVRAAHQELLQKRGIDEKDYEKAMLKLGRNGLERMNSSKASRNEKRKADAEAAKKSSAKSGEIVVQQGLDESNVVEEGGIKVQRGAGKSGIEIPVPQEGDDAAGAPTQPEAGSKRDAKAR